MNPLRTRPSLLRCFSSDNFLVLHQAAQRTESDQSGLPGIVWIVMDEDRDVVTERESDPGVGGVYRRADTARRRRDEGRYVYVKSR